MHEKTLRQGGKVMTLKIKVKVIHNEQGFSPNMMHIWCKYDESTKCCDLELEGHDLEYESQGQP